MTVKPTLLVLAAGMGSRYGGLKQLDPLGPHGETIMDYSIYDAVRAGFGRVVFVIRHDFEKEFNERVLSRYRGYIPVDVVFQTSEDLPEGFEKPADRTRPWGTGHAVLVSRSAINEPFAVINADDFYGRHAFTVIADFLNKHSNERGRYCMVGFKVGNTMTENGSVSRGVCTVDRARRLRSIIERRAIAYNPDGSIGFVNEETGRNVKLDPATPVSMNLWGFTPDIYEFAHREFGRFLTKYISDGKREFYIPSVVDKLIGTREATVDVLGTDSKWFGVTYAQDRQGVVDALAALHSDGQYPDNLFSSDSTSDK